METARFDPTLRVVIITLLALFVVWRIYRNLRPPRPVVSNIRLGRLVGALKNWQFPWLYVAEGLLFPLGISGFFTTTSFFAAVPPASLELHGKALPATWEAAVPNHGGYFEWYLMANHPVLFALGLLLLVGSASILREVHKAQTLQREQLGTSSDAAHTIARGFVMASFAATAYWWVFHVAAIIMPA